VATYSRSDLRARGEQALRQTWQTIGHHSSRASRRFAQIMAYMASHPALVQGLYYVLVGLWSLLSFASFQVVTGAKGDLVLARTVSLLILVIGGALCLAAYRKQLTPEVWLIALGSAVGLAVRDIHYVSAGYLSAVYLLDAVIQLGAAGLWVYGWYQRRRQRPPAGTPA
jgi:hypothetical protein